MTIVVGFTPSGQGMAALAAAVREARRGRDELVVASHTYHHSEHGPAVAGEEETRSALAEVGGEDVDWSLRRSGDQEDVGEFLLSAAAESSARLLVIGLRRKSPIGKLNLGVAARRVVLGADIPVLAVKDETPSGALAS